MQDFFSYLIVSKSFWYGQELISYIQPIGSHLQLYRVVKYYFMAHTCESDNWRCNLQPQQNDFESHKYEGYISNSVSPKVVRQCALKNRLNTYPKITHHTDIKNIAYGDLNRSQKPILTNIQLLNFLRAVPHYEL